jgi:hypothetical protein
MVVKVRLRGLKIVKARGRYYVYGRATGQPLIQGFEGSREELMRKLEAPELMQAYNRPRLQRRRAADFPIETLGGFIHWYTNGDIDRDRKVTLDNPGAEENGYPKWSKLARATREDYLDAYEYLREDYDILLTDITQPDLYETRDICANRKWPRFADQMIAALSSLFRQAVKRGKMPFNPCTGMDDAHIADPNSNREWFPEEWEYARANAPMEVLIPLMLARHCGLRGQTIVKVNKKQTVDHELTGKAIRYFARKNKKIVTLPMMQEMQDFLAGIKVARTDGTLCVRDDGTLWKSEKEMQTRVSHWLRDQERAGHLGNGTTLHGLRVSYAAWWLRNGATIQEITDLIGDVSERMGKHYTRHVQSEININRAFQRVKDKA